MTKLTDAQKEVLRIFHARRIDHWYLPTDGAVNHYNIEGRLHSSVKVLLDDGYLVRGERGTTPRDYESGLFLTAKGKAAFATLTLPLVENMAAHLRAIIREGGFHQ